MTVRDRFEGGLELGEGLDPVNFRRGDERSNAPPGAVAFVVACKKCVLSRQGQFPFILPMSAKFIGFIINGMPILART